MDKLIILLFLPFLIWSCQDTSSEALENAEGQLNMATPQTAAMKTPEKDFKLGDYWYQGKAELSRYELKQNRYDALHPGEAVTIFVTEDFLTDKQVKNDQYTSKNSTPILKLNMVKRFTTGLYDYSMMTSVFTPTKLKEVPQTLKVSFSSQDWCGHAYMQLNYEDGAYKSTLHSYFESEADRVTNFDYVLLEDEMMNRIRMNPDMLPLGKMQLLPSTTILRLLHLPAQAVEASASMSTYAGTDIEGENLKVYTITFPRLKRTLEIVFQSEEPYIIEGWTDAYPSMFDKKIRKTVAQRKETIMSPYWQKNSPEDAEMRAKLGL
ncbi:MAG: hypothetical protein MI974_13630 [Chitinophagales bacterium]|nr:hypothetical protein [Chitinophagales bacterium]